MMTMLPASSQVATSVHPLILQRKKSEQPVAHGAQSSAAAAGQSGAWRFGVQPAASLFRSMVTCAQEASAAASAPASEGAGGMDEQRSVSTQTPSTQS
jgi:hypothetical protein